MVQSFCNFTRLQPMLSILQLNNEEHEQGWNGVSIFFMASKIPKFILYGLCNSLNVKNC